MHPFARACALAALVLPLAIDSASAEKWLLAEEKDKDIRKRLEPLLPLAQQQGERFDSDVVVVFDQRQFEVDSSSYQEYENRVWWVRRGEAEDLTNYVRDFWPRVKVEEVKAFRIRGGGLDPATALGGKFEKLDDDRIRIQKGDEKTRLTNLVVAFDTAQPGDILGISIRKKIQEPLYWRSWPVADVYPVTRAELRLKNEWYLAYTVFGHRMAEGSMEKKVLDENDGHVRDLRVWIDGVAPIFDEPYAPPAHLQSPSLAVVWRASKEETIGNVWVWWYNRHWNQVASRMSRDEARVLRDRSRAAEQAGELARNLEAETAAAAMYHFVRDDLLDIPSSMYGENLPSVDQILSNRGGAIWEKAYLLLAMLDGRGLPAEILWTHDPDEGGFFRQYPVWGQVDVPLVRVDVEGRGLWYDLGCGTCAPGEVRPRLRGQRALRYRRDSAQRNEDLADTAIRHAYAKQQDPYAVYLSMVDKVDWCEFVEVPGRSGELAGFVFVRRTVSDPSGQEARVSIESGGSTSIRGAVHAARSVNDLVPRWARSRYDDLEDVTVETASDPVADTLRVTLVVRSAPLPDPVGDTWILPAEFVYGEPVVGAWPDERLTPFFIGKSLDRRWELRIPLPEGWQDVAVPEDQALGVDPLQYRVRYEVHDGEFRVTRQLLERESRVEDEKSLDIIGEEVRAIHELETRPVVLQLAGSGR